VASRGTNVCSHTRTRRSRTLVSRFRHAQLVLTGAVTAAALVSVWHGARPTWHQLGAGYATYAAYSGTERLEAPLTSAAFPVVVGDLFAFASADLVRGDRVYFQVPRTPYGTLDLHDTVAALGRFFFLPAVEVRSLDDATVVFSYDANPSALHRRFVRTTPLGSASLSRLSYP
jgi:hypothetical protein